jgi:hypothetical protein
MQTFRPMASKESKEARSTLVREYTLATKHYASAVRELTKQRPWLTRSGYATMYQLVEESRENCERLQRALANLGD